MSGSSVEALLAAAALQSTSNFEYSLDIVQQPVRARMCGLGDRDRRPITPPLIAKLLCKDLTTGQMIPASEIDTTFLICSVDLRTPDLRDANLTRNASALLSNQFGQMSPPLSVHNFVQDPKTGGYRFKPPSSPDTKMVQYSDSVKSTTLSTGDRRSSVSSYSLPTPPPMNEGERAMLDEDERSCQSHTASNTIETLEEEETSAWIEPKKAPLLRPPPSPRSSPELNRDPPKLAAHSPTNVLQRSTNTYNFTTSNSALDEDEIDDCEARSVKRRRISSAASSATSAQYDYRQPVPLPLPMPLFSTSSTPTVPNLIGALHTNAYKLTDEKGEPGVFFVLPDLSVRTEGPFRLRLRLMSIGATVVNCNKASMPLMASTHSQVFSVTSAKKFEGMMDPTPLSKTFARQGVRIPTRKVAKRAPKKSGSCEEDD